MKPSTCVIAFITGEITVRIFRGFDSFPERMLDDLHQFLKWNAGRNDCDARFLAANFILWGKLEWFNDANEAKTPENRERRGFREYAIDDPPIARHVDYRYDVIRTGRHSIVRAYRYTKTSRGPFAVRRYRC